MTKLSEGRQIATASYIQEMLVELRTMGQQINADFLVYLLEMAIIEADTITKGKMTPGRVETPVEQQQPGLSAEQLASLYMTGKLNA